MAAQVILSTKDCSVCKRNSILVVSTKGYFQWTSGATIEKAFPELSEEDKQLLETGIHSACINAPKLKDTHS